MVGHRSHPEPETDRQYGQNLKVSAVVDLVSVSHVFVDWISKYIFEMSVHVCAPMQVFKSCVRDAPERHGPAAGPRGERWAGGGDPHGWVQGIQSWDRAGGILATRR